MTHRPCLCCWLLCPQSFSTCWTKHWFSGNTDQLYEWMIKWKSKQINERNEESIVDWYSISLYLCFFQRTHIFWVLYPGISQRIFTTSLWGRHFNSTVVMKRSRLPEAAPRPADVSSTAGIQMSVWFKGKADGLFTTLNLRLNKCSPSIIMEALL